MTQGAPRPPAARLMVRAGLRIVDPCAPHAYAELAHLDRLGGTEATVLRVAGALVKHMDVSVEQVARGHPEVVDDVRFLRMDTKRVCVGTILVVNSWKVALECRRHSPRARVLVWQHDEPADYMRPLLAILAAADIGFVCASRALAARLRRIAGDAAVSIAVVPNPIADDLQPDHTARDPDLLFFASSQHKGLEQVLQAFASLRRAIPTLRLEVADPGYLTRDNGVTPTGVVALGTLPHEAVIRKMREALCLFYPQTRFAEPFGLVIAEANAVGCPALVHHGLGANDEVVSDAGQSIDGADPQMIAARILAWRRSPPAVTVRPRFRLAAVAQSWRQLLATSRIGISEDSMKGVPDAA